MTTITLGAGRHRFELKITTIMMVDEEEVTRVGNYVKIGTKSEQKPNDFSDFSDNCAPNPEDVILSTTMEVVADYTTEINFEYNLIEDADGLKDNFGNIYACVEAGN